jgi:hypothetical protein
LFDFFSPNIAQKPQFSYTGGPQKGEFLRAELNGEKGT